MKKQIVVFSLITVMLFLAFSAVSVEATVDDSIFTNGKRDSVSPATKPLYAVFTFDDGYESVFQYALPLLKARGIHGGVYVATEFIGGLFEGKPMLTWSELKALRDAGWEIGSHSHNHGYRDSRGGSTSPIEILYQWWQSERILEQRLGITVDTLTYPGGVYSNLIMAICRLVGYKYGRTTNEGLWNGSRSLAINGNLLDDYGYSISVPNRINDAKAENMSVVFFTHEVKPNAGTDGLSPENLAWCLDYCISQGFQIKTFHEIAKSK